MFDPLTTTIGKLIFSPFAEQRIRRQQRQAVF
jgi:hypothetical protein